MKIKHVRNKHIISIDNSRAIKYKRKPYPNLNTFHVLEVRLTFQYKKVIHGWVLIHDLPLDT